MGRLLQDAQATHLGDDLHGIPATGKRVEFNIADLFRIEDRPLVESFALLDEARLLHQIGVDIPVWL